MAIPELALHATLRKANVGSTRNGKKTYKLAFEYPVGYREAIADMVGTEIDILWNEELVAHGAYVTGATEKAIKGEDNVYTVSMDAPAVDTTLVNTGAHVGDAGDLRFRLLQAALGLTD